MQQPKYSCLISYESVDGYRYNYSNTFTLTQEITEEHRLFYINNLKSIAEKHAENVDGWSPEIALGYLAYMTGRLFDNCTDQSTFEDQMEYVFKCICALDYDQGTAFWFDVDDQNDVATVEAIPKDVFPFCVGTIEEWVGPSSTIWLGRKGVAA